MSLVSSRLSLTHRCTVQRDASTFAGFGTGAFGSGSLGPPGTDDWGNQRPSQWSDYLPNVTCRVWTTAGRETVDANTTVVVEDVRLLMPLGTDVTEHDRIGDITYRGAVIVPGPVGIRAVLPHADHLELVLVKIA